MATSSNHEVDLSMIIVMGVTGAGKSYFINSLAGSDVVETGHRLESCTATCQIVPVNIGRSKVLLLDTPGFDDSARSDSEILAEISRVLSAQHESGIKLKGVIYLHRITDIRYAGTSAKTLEIFKKICGDVALRNVLLVTSRWDGVDKTMGASREQQLRENFWAYMLGNGSTMARFHGNRDSAIGIASQLMSRQSIVLEVQRELFDDRKTLEQTVVGAFVNNNISARKAEYEAELKELGRLRELPQTRSDRAMKKQIEKDQAKEQNHLQTAYVDEELLRHYVAAEVHETMDERRKETGGKNSIGLREWLSLLPVVLGVVQIFVKIPEGSMPRINEWLSRNEASIASSSNS